MHLEASNLQVLPALHHQERSHLSSSLVHHRQCRSLQVFSIRHCDWPTRGAIPGSDKGSYHQLGTQDHTKVVPNLIPSPQFAASFVSFCPQEILHFADHNLTLNHNRLARHQSSAPLAFHIGTRPAHVIEWEYRLVTTISDEILD